MMIFTSVDYILFLTIVVFLYYIIPVKYKNICLLLASYIFIGISDIKTVPVIFIYSVVVYYGALLMQKNKGKMLFGVLIILSICPLIICKCTNIISILGISYFTFKSIGYLVDVKNNKYSADKNFINVLLYISFFSELLIGPIDRGNILLKQISGNNHKFQWCMVKEGVLMILCGCIQKLVIADRLGIIVNAVYGSLYNHEGFTVIAAALMYSIQIYFDYAGCSLMAIGTGRILGFEHPVNFSHPYFAHSVKDFWRRWHISLTSWLRDYIYIPLGGNRKGQFRKYINIAIVFILSGLWHGVGFTYVIWGALNGLFQVIEDFTERITGNKGRLGKSLGIIRTYLLMTICWVFFRADNLEHAILILKKAFYKFNPGVLFDGTLNNLGLSEKNMYLLMIMIIIVLIVGIAEEKGIDIYKYVIDKPFVVQLTYYIVMIVIIAVFGIYGKGYDSMQFIYMNF